jgi:peptidoglycan/xylan/chitin deacetylase (PgdA/CDA1 family)
MTDISPTKPGIAILMYHSIASSTTPSFRPYTVDPLRFDEHLSALSGAGCRFVRVEEVPALLAGSARTPDEGPTVAISIDDGLTDAASVAAPVLERHRKPATLFVPSGYVGGAATWMAGEDGERPILGWSALRDLSAAGWEIGSHGHLHLAADINRPDLVREDADRSREELEAQLGRAVTSYAYPFGCWTPAAREAVRSAGFSQACAIMELPAMAGDHPFALPRIHIKAETTAEMLLALVSSRPVGFARRRAEVGQRVWRTGRRWGLWRSHDSGVIASASAPETRGSV